MSVKSVLSKLIAFPTICRTPNVDLIDWVASWLENLAFRVTKVLGETPGQSSLLASIGPETPNGIVFSAHSDVVPVAGQPWTSDPFKLVDNVGKLTGRGVSDMKGFLACMLVAAEYASKHQEKLKHPIHLAVSHDEEIGCVGVRSLLAHMKSNNFQARGCIVGEPTEKAIVTGHKGKIAVKVQCTGISGHSADPGRGSNAIMLASDLMKAVEEMQSDLAQEKRDEGYRVPYSTAQVGVVHGGMAVNTIPEYCEFDFEMRLLPHTDGEKYVERIRRIADILVATKYPKGSVSISQISAYPGLDTSETSEFFTEMKALLPKETEATRVNFGTEGGTFQEMLGLPVIVCGPGSIDRAHRPDEWVTESELEDSVKFLNRVTDSLQK